MDYKILIIEDDEGIVNLIRKNLAEEGYGVVNTDSGRKALDLFYRENPDLVILDLKIKDIHGLEVCRVIRRDEKYDDVPILIISGYISDEDRIEGLSMGADDYIVKPFNMKELMIRVRNALRRVNPPVREKNVLVEKNMIIIIIT